MYGFITIVLYPKTTVVVNMDYIQYMNLYLYIIESQYLLYITTFTPTVIKMIYLFYKT